MVQYKIPYYSYSMHIPHFIQKYIFESGINGDAFLCDGEIIISLNDKEEKVRAFFEKLGEKLPLSVFIRNGELCDKPIVPIFCSHVREIDLGICPSCFNLLFDNESVTYLDQNMECELCGSVNKKLKNYEIEKLVQELLENKEIEVNDAVYRLLDNNLDGHLIVFNQEALKRDFFVSYDEMLLLNAIERPLINLVKRSDIDTLNILPPLALCRFPFDAFEYVLGFYLKEKGIDYLACRTKIEPIIIMSVEDKRIIVSGDRGYMPLVLKTKKIEHSTLAIATGYGAKNIESECSYIAPLSKLKIEPVKKVALLEDEEMIIEHPNLVEFSDFKAVILAISNEFKLDRAIGVYLSEKSKNSGIYLLEQGNFKPILKIDSKTSTKELLEKIKNESGKETLLDKFFSKFEVPLDIESKNLGELFSIFCTLIDSSIPKESLLKKAHAISQSAAFDRSVKLDMKSIKLDDCLVFNPIKTLNSILSFKLAGAEKDMLFYALFESFCDYINEAIIEASKSSGIKDVIANGSFFANRVFTKRLMKHSKNIYNLNFSNYLPLDGASLAIGGIFAINL